VEKNYKSYFNLNVMALVLNEIDVNTILFKENNDIIIIIMGFLVDLKDCNINTVAYENMVLLGHTNLDFQY
jgi:hypothetical protein